MLLLEVVEEWLCLAKDSAKLKPLPGMELLANPKAQRESHAETTSYQLDYHSKVK